MGYVATHSTRQLAPIDLNAGQVIGAGADGKPLFAKWGRDAQTLELRPIGTGHFDSMQAQLQRRFTGGLALTVNYTFGKGINITDNSSYQLAVNAQRYLDLNRSVTGFDRTHNFAVTSVWELPFGKGKHWLSSSRGRVRHPWWLAGEHDSEFDQRSAVLGWRGRYVIEHAREYAASRSGGTGDEAWGESERTTPTFRSLLSRASPSPDSGTAASTLSAVRASSTWTSVSFVNSELTERFRLQFRAESFNFTNTPHFGNPDGYVGDGSDFMTITGTTNLAREGIDERQFRFGLKFSF